MTIPEFKKIARILKEAYKDLEQEAVNNRTDIFGEEYKQAQDVIRETILNKQGFTLEEYRQVKDSLVSANKSKVTQDIELIKQTIEELKSKELPTILSREDILSLAHEVAKQYIVAPIITNKIIKEIIVEKPKIIETIREVTNKVEYDPSGLIKDFDKKIAEIKIPELPNLEVLKSELRSEWETQLKDNISIKWQQEMPDFRKLAMGLQGQIDELKRDDLADVNSVTGTTNRISVSPTTGNVVVDISASYAGQSSITTLGTIGTGVWNAGAVTTTNLTDSALTSGRIPYASTGGLLADTSLLTWNNATQTMTVKNIILPTASSFQQQGTGSAQFGTGGAVFNGTGTFIGDLSLAASISQGMASTVDGTSAYILGVENDSASGSVTLNGINASIAGYATSGANVMNAIYAPTPYLEANNTANLIVVDTGWNSILKYNGTVIINGLGVVQSAGISGSYTGITGVGTLSVGTVPAARISAGTFGTGAFSIGATTFTGNLTTSAVNIVTDTTTGTKIGTATNQKLGFFNSTPIVQPTGDVITALQNLGLGASLTVTATTNANLTGPITSVGNATSIASQTGTGTKFVVDTSPTLVTPNIGAATGSSLNLSSGTLTAGLINNSNTITTSIPSASLVNAISIVNATSGVAAGIYNSVAAGSFNLNDYYFSQGYTTSGQYRASGYTQETAGNLTFSSGHSAGGGNTQFYVNDVLKQTISSTGVTIAGDIRFSAVGAAAVAGQIGLDATYGMYNWAKTGSVDDYALFGNDGAYVMHVPTGTHNMAFAGNVGIGETAPTEKLYIKGSETTAYASSSGSLIVPAGGVNTTIQNTGSGGFAGLHFVSLNSSNAVGYMGFTNNTASVGGSFVWGQRTGASSYAEQMRLSDVGNLGIGLTPNASYRLHIQGLGTTSSTYGLVIQKSSGSVSAYVRDDGVAYFGGPTTVDNTLLVTGNATIGLTGTAEGILNILSTDGGHTNINLGSASNANYASIIGNYNGGTPVASFYIGATQTARWRTAQWDYYVPIVLNSTLNLHNYTVATLPAGTRGDIAYATDLLAPGFLVAAVGGGAVVGPVFYNGAAWVAF